MQARIVNTGIDTVKVNVKLLNAETQQPLSTQAVSEPLITLFQSWQDQAKEHNKSVKTTLTLNDARLLMFPNGASAWKYILRNDSIEIKVCPRLNVPMIAKVTFQSGYLWQVGAIHKAVEEVHSFLEDLFREPLLLQVAQLDLCVDLVGLSLPTEWEKVFISHALGKRPIGESHKDQAVYKGRRLETILFSGHGKPVSCKIYDKWREIEQHSEKTWFYPLWEKNGWNRQACQEEKVSVWRVEYAVGREAFNEMDLDNIYDALRESKWLWHYCTHDWLRMVKPARTKNRTRWPIHPTWTLIQHAFDTYGSGELDGLGPLVREEKREVNLDRAVAAIAGYITTYAAWDDEALSEEDDAATIFSVLYDRVLERWNKQRVLPQDLVREKKFLYSRKG
jgi:hypothetical protein